MVPRFDGVLGKNVAQRALQAGHDLLETPQGDALLGLLQPKQCGLGQTELSGELLIRQFAPPLPEELTQLSFQTVSHAGTLPERSFHLWNI
jgi:hypothetical protein